MPEPAERTNDRAFQVLPWITFAVLILVFASTLWAAVNSTTTNDNLAAQARSDEIAACYRTLRAPIDSTDAQLDRAKTAQTVLFFAGLAAVVQEDQATVDDLIGQEPQVRKAVSEAQRAKDLAVAAYERAAKLPVEQFLTECRER